MNVGRERMHSLFETDDLNGLEPRSEFLKPTVEEAECRIVLVDRLGHNKYPHGRSKSERTTGQRPSPTPPSRRISNSRMFGQQVSTLASSRGVSSEKSAGTPL